MSKASRRQRRSLNVTRISIGLAITTGCLTVATLGMAPMPDAQAASVTKATSGAASYSFLMPGQGANPTFAARWNRCTTIRWGVDMWYARRRGINANQEFARLRSAINEAAAVTGYRFQYRGRIDGRGSMGGLSFFASINDDAYLANGGLDLVVTYAGAARAGAYTNPELRNALGIGGMQATSSQLPSGQSGQQATTGFAILDAADVKQLVRRKRPGVVRTLYLHEIGHALGLDHTMDRRQIMYPSAGQGVIRYGAGDKRGLKLLASAPCFVADADPLSERTGPNVSSTTRAGAEQSVNRYANRYWND